MNPWVIRKAKALLWYWLNHHPSEVYKSCSEIHASDAMGTLEKYTDLDMLVVSSRTGWRVGSGLTDVLMSFYQDPDRWHDINLAVSGWMEGQSPEDNWKLYKFLKAVKGMPLSRWGYAYTGLKVPRWDGLVKAFMDRDILKVETGD